MIVLFNPLSTTPGKQGLPLSLLSLAAVLDGQEAWALVDGNLTLDPASDIIRHLEWTTRDSLAMLAVSVMPGPQLTQAVAVSKAVKTALPHVTIVWGGYFPTQHAQTVLRADYVDVVVRSQGERALLGLAWALRRGGPLARVANLSWKDAAGIHHNPLGAPVALDELPDLPYARVDMDEYVRPTYLGRRTAAHVTSFGCPFACSFCAVVAMSNRRWLAQSPARVERVARHLVDTYAIDSLQMYDMDFFIDEDRAREIADRLAPLNLGWWGLGRVDTLLGYKDSTWEALKRSGLRMLFSGAESGSAAALAAMNKGGKAQAGQALELARRARNYGIVPEFSFVLGAPPEPERDLDETFDYIRAIKRVNPAVEIILYTYTPVPSDSGMSADAMKAGFAYPDTLEGWVSDEWRQLSLRRGRGLPWMNQRIRRRIRNFERVLNAYYPTVTDTRLTGPRRALLRALSGWRYRFGIYTAPVELSALHHVMAYQRPETTGF